MARHWSEEVARRYLEGQGYEVLETNYTCRRGEVDLIAREGEVLVFVEVKQRKNTLYGTPADAISAAKIAKLRHTALHYLTETYERDDLPLRFDAVLLTGTDKNYRLEHLKAAF